MASKETRKLLSCILFSIIIFITINQITAFKNCPKRCTCSAGSVTCSDGNLEMIPKTISPYTKSFVITRSKIKEVMANQFVELEDMKTLTISRNHYLIKVSEMAFKGLMYLKRLSLTNNQRLKMLPTDVFKPLKYLQELQLYGNKLMTLPSSIEDLVYLSLIDLRKNMFHCDCRLAYFATTLHYFEEINQYAKCHKPENMFKQRLNNITLKEFHCENVTEISGSDPNIMAPYIMEKPHSQVATSGEKIELRCTVKGNKVIVDWILPLPQMENVRFLRRNQSLFINELHDYHTGVYTCRAKNIYGVETASASVAIATQLRPQITEGPVDQTVYVGDDVIFRCNVTARPPANVNWFIFRDSLRLLGTNSKYVVRPKMLIILNVTEKDSGRYDCYASNRAGSIQVSARLYVMANRMEPNYNIPTSPDKAAAVPLDNTKLVEQAIENARKKVEQAIFNTAERLRNPNRRRSSADIQTLFRQPNQAALELAKASQVYETALEEITNILRQHKVQFNFSGNQFPHSILTNEQLLIISQLSGCQSQVGTDDEIRCEERLCFHKNYRTVDGICNNLNYPKWGSAPSAFRRMLPPMYENGVNTPIGWKHDKLYYGYPKPSSRLVSRELLAAKKISPDMKYTVMLMQWGQFLDHDLTFTPVDASTSRFSDGLNCNETCVNDPPCFPILIPPNDPRIHRRCIGFTRSSATCGSGSTSILFGKPHFREQINQITGFLDASNVYGSEPLQQDQLREIRYDEGELKFGVPTPSGKRLMPFNVRGQIDCQANPSENVVACFKAGDHRSNENLGLLSIHTIWMREHNRIVRRLRFLNPHWTGDKLYFEGRKIVGGMMQYITYNHWLPHIIGPESMMKLGKYKAYDDQLDPSISNAFATAAFRFGHTLIQPFQFRLDENFTEIPEGHLPLHRSFFAPDTLLKDGGVDPLLRGLFGSPGKLVTPNEPMNSELTEKLFQLAHEVALDLAALNVQRGRDHGLPGYTMWRKNCGLSRAETFDQLRIEIPSADIRERLRRVYGHPGNMDLFTGGVLEEPLPGAKVGPTFACILVDQFRRLRDGDRFWFENPEIFPLSQQAQIRQASLSRIICDNGDNITQVQRDVFLRAANKGEYRKCKEFPEINLLGWKECVGYIAPLAEQQVPPNRRRRRSANNFYSADQQQHCPSATHIFSKLNRLQNEIEELKKRLP